MGKWSKEEDAHLLEMVKTANTRKELYSLIPNRTASAIKGKLSRLGIVFIPKETDAELNVIPGEEWRRYNETPYWASSLGRIRRDRGRNGQCQRLLKPCVTRRYLSVNMRLEGHKKRRQTSIFVHKVVAHVFLGPRPPGMTINHKDGNHLNNAATNLEYLTSRDNYHHAMRLGLAPVGETHGSSKITEEIVRRIRKLRDEGVSYYRIGKELGISSACAWHVGVGNSWKHVI